MIYSRSQSKRLQRPKPPDGKVEEAFPENPGSIHGALAQLVGHGSSTGTPTGQNSDQTGHCKIWSQILPNGALAQLVGHGSSTGTPTGQNSDQTGHCKIWSQILPNGALAQLVARDIRIVEVRGSTPLCSTQTLEALCFKGSSLFQTL